LLVTKGNINFGGIFMKNILKKQLKNFATTTAIITISPFILGTVGLGNSYAAEKAPIFKPSHDPIQYQGAPASYSEAILRASPAVVSIHSSRQVTQEMHPLMQDPFFRQFFGDPRKGNQPPPQETQSGIGSGVIVTTNGYILTNNHVISGADEIEIKLADGRSSKAKVIGRDLETDLAILKVDLKKLPTVALGSSDKAHVGDIVFAIGNPFNVGVTVTQGIISATHRSHLGINIFENFIQTDAAINPGNSGGALIDANGNLIGINNAIYSRTGGYQGIGFAIPVEMAKDIMGQLISNGHVTRGWLGITVHKLTDELRKSLDYPKGEGTVIASVIRGGPAAKAGLRSGDIIININETDVKDPSDVLKVTAKLKPEKAYPIAVIRQGETHDLRVEIGKRPTDSDNEEKDKKKKK
tara:strand:+ start:69692 stop:70927 length:1236 start_codon:yes stop_codon:yes gene_type:complete